MGRTARRKPLRLAEKLLHIRQALGMSQNQLIRYFGFEELVQGTISAFESGAREPSLLVLLAYARAVNVSVESLIDDDLDLPDKLSDRVEKAKGINRRGQKRVYNTRAKRK
jgi:transcriptional regulator with XRE-family HTH domain